MYRRYLRSVLLHKLFVFRECCRAGIVVRGVLHDLSKFHPAEFVPFARWAPRLVRDASGYYDPLTQPDRAYVLGVVRHRSRNDHHPEHWQGAEMGADAVTEMVCDWIGATLSQGRPRCDVHAWFEKNRSRLNLHRNTELLVAKTLERLV